MSRENEEYTYNLTNLKKTCSTLLTTVYEVDCNFSVLTYKTILS